MLPQCVLLLYLFSPSKQLTILAYADPGSGTLIWQLATASLLGLLFYARTFWQKIRLLFRHSQIDQNEDSPK
jgi:hypothetical protein